MRHGNKVKRVGRPADHRKAMMNNLATSILKKGLAEEQSQRFVKTTTAKAKAVRGLVDRLITYAKAGDLSAKRQAAKFVKDKEAFKGLFGVLGERYQERIGGYTRVLKISDRRHGDSAEMAIVSLVEDEVAKKKKKRKKKAAAKPKEAVKATEEKAEAPEVSAEEVKPAAEEKADKPAPKAENAETTKKAEDKPAEEK